jgi:hypothetical protein
MTTILKICKNSIYFYAFPTPKELSQIESKFDEISDSGFILKSLTEEAYEAEIENFNSIERSDFESEMLEMQSFELSYEFERLVY